MLFLCLLFSGLAVDCQIGTPDRFVVGGSGGFLIAHREALEGLATAHAYGVSVETQWFTSGEKRWHSLYNRPVWGFQLQYLDLGNPDLLGKQLSLAVKTAFPIGAIDRNFEHRWFAGLGAGYSSKTWDLDENLRTMVLSTHFNALLTIGYEAQWDFSDRFGLHAGIQVTHQSNAALRMPNLGTNVMNGSLGMTFSPAGKPAMNKDVSFLSYLPARWSQRIAATFGLKENLPPGGKRYGIYLLSHEFEYRRNWKTALFLRNDLFWNTAARPLAEKNSETVDGLPELQHGVGIGLTKYYGRLSGSFMIAAYTIAPYNEKGLFYHRLMGRYQLTEKLDFTLGMRLHWAKADHPEIGVHLKL